ncbi:MAG: hypothetical protein O7D96_11485 [SAR324 cluster bacterium]|nr:hypothetical protein [SAR324 cluster bacterium]
MSDKGPITDAEWVEGVTIERWLEANAPEAYREAVENKVWVPTSPPFPDDDWKDRRYWPVVAQCRKVLVEAIEHKEIDLRTPDPPDSSLAQWKSFSDHTQHAIAANWCVGARSGEEYLEHVRSYVFVMVFRPRRWQDSTKFVRWAKERLEEKYKVWKALIAAGKPQDRKPKAEILSELRNEKPELSQTGAEKAWKKAHISKWKDPGFIKGRRRKPRLPMD